MVLDKIKIYEDELFNNIIRDLSKNSNVEEIILAGSFGRNEQSYLIKGDNFQLLSDIEIVVSYRKNKKEIYELLIKTKKKYNEELNFIPTKKRRIKNALNYNYNILKPKKYTIFTFDLFNSGKTIYGKECLNFKINSNDIMEHEGDKLVGNRIGEYYWNIFQQSNDTEINRWACKIILAIGSSYLLKNNLYEPSFVNQSNKILSNSAIKELFSNDFIVDYYKSYLYLKQKGDEYIVPINHLKNYIDIYKKFILSKSHKKWDCLTHRVRLQIKYFKKYKKIKFNIEKWIIYELINNFGSTTDIKDYVFIWKEILY